MHIMQHLKWYVAEDVIEVVRNRSFTNGKGGWLYEPFFVHPRTGLLARNKEYLRWWKGGRALPTPRYVVLDGKNYRKINDVWYEVELRPLPPRGAVVWGHMAPYPSVYDVMLRTEPSYDEARGEHGADVCATNKRQLNGREIKRLKLNDEPPKMPAVVR